MGFILIIELLKSKFKIKIDEKNIKLSYLQSKENKICQKFFTNFERQ